MTKTEAGKLLDACTALPKAGRYMELFVAIALHSGQRKEAILSLRWPQVNLEAETINWNPLGRIQNNKRRPIARIPPRLIPYLHRARQFGDELGFVVHHDGKRIGDVKKSFAKACDLAGLVDVTPHTLRHTRATWGMQAGNSIWELAGFLGMTPETLEKVYGHHHPDYQKSAASNY
ncbi:MAG: site-specific integrase [Rhizobiaceae bacterium]